MIAPTPAPPMSAPPADPTAVIGRRIAAYLIDWVVIAAITFGAFVALASTADVPVQFADAQDYCDRITERIDNYVCIPADTTVILAEDSDMAVVSLVGLIAFIVSQMILPALTGFSPGKVLVGLRIVKKDSFAKAGLGANIGRSLLWIVDSAPWCFPLVGLITGLSSNGHRRVGDMAAGTLVVDRKWVDHPLPVAGVNSVGTTTAIPPYGTGAPPMSPPVLPGATAPPPPGTPPTSPPPPTGFPPPPSSTPPPAPTADSIAPPATPPTPAPGAPAEPPPTGEPDTSVPAPDPDATSVFTGFDAPPADAPGPDPTTVVPAAGAAPSEPPPPQPAPPAPSPPPPAPEPEAPRPGIDAPQWDAARDTYIQWDPELREWMEWSESQGRWIPISQ